jgi:GNAT superfamily N-acetyltransferase
MVQAPYIIRPAMDRDQSGVLHCLATAFEPYRQDYTTLGFADTVLDQRAFPERRRKMHILVAASGSGIIGTIAGAYQGTEGHLRGMAVLPAWRGTGLAAQLLLAMESWLAEKGCSRVTLDTTLPLKAAMRFYEKNGYLRSGRRSDFFGMPLLEYFKNL